jgi:transcriptional regulator with XRE-family HTH domain
MKNSEETINQRVRRLRKQAGLTVAALATSAGVSPQTVKDIEAGRKDVGAKSLSGLAKAFKVSVEQLLEDKKVEVDKVAVITPKKALKMYMSLPDWLVERAQEHAHDSKVWGLIQMAFDEVEALEKKQKTAHDSKKHLG